MTTPHEVTMKLGLHPKNSVSTKILFLTFSIRLLHCRNHSFIHSSYEIGMDLFTTGFIE
jgi:hypothetical protein